MSSAASSLEQRYGRLVLTAAAASILFALFVLAGLSWAYMAASGGVMPMSAGADLAGFVLFLTTWVVMMGAMMFPTVAPVVLVYSRYTRRQTRWWSVRTTLFVTGYLVIWTAAGVVAWMIVMLLVPALAAIPMVQAAPQLFLGAVLAAAGLYQLTPLKKACLGHCRSPMHWIFLGFRPGKPSVGWMAAVAAVIFIEKVIAPTAAVAKGVAILLLTLGIAVATIPAVADFMLRGGPI